MLISFLIFLPLIGSLIIFISKDFKFYRFFALVISMFNFFLSLFFWILFDKSSGYFQFCEIYNWNYFNILLGIDGLSLFFIILTTFLIAFCILYNWNNILNFKSYVIYFFFIESLLILFFTSLNLLIFFIVFESLLIPLFLLIGVFGSGRRKVRSGYFFFFYTLVSSILFLFSIIYIYLLTGTFNYLILISLKFENNIQFYLWLGFFFAFASKIPIFPFHLWLPEAHVEAPTGGSVLLAGILLKLGTYGVIRFLIPLFKDASFFFLPLIFLLCIISIIYASGTAIRQSDIKRVIAYTSIAHMNLVILGSFSFNLLGFAGSIFQMLSHGIVSSALFFCIGVLYSKFHTRLIDDFGGLVQLAPKFSIFFFIFTLANMGFPCTSNFAGEFLIFLGLVFGNFFVLFLSLFGLIFSGAYSLWIYNRVVFGNVKVKKINDTNFIEFYIFIIFSLLCIFFGIYPNSILDSIFYSSLVTLEYLV